MKKLLMVLILIPMVALATTYYVDASSGLDSNSGKSAAAAKKTIQAAIDASSSGDTILVAAGTYDPINAVGKVLTIRSVGGASVTVIDGKGTKRCAFLSDEEGSFGPPTESSGAFDSVLDGFTLKNGYHNNSGEANNSGAGVSGGTVENCVIINCRARSGAGASNSKLHRCEIRDNVAGDDGGGLVGCIADNSLLCRNKAHNEGGGRAGSAASCSQLYNCTVTENVATGKDGYVAAIDYYMTVRNCIVWGNTDTSGNAADVIYTVVDTCCTSNPKFVDVANGNYRLALDSPCIDTGDNTYVVGSSDLDGNARIVNGKVDIGCYEFGSSETLENGLVACYKFDGNANDSSGKGNDGVVHGATLTADRFGNANSAYSFDGADDWIEVAHTASLSMNAMTVSVWLKPNGWSHSNGDWIPVICKANYWYAEGSYRFEIQKDGDGVDYQLKGEVYSAVGIDFGQWQQITVTLGSDGLKVYRNGLFIGVDTSTDQIENLSDVLAIGRSLVGSTEYYNGDMDDLRIYNCVLSAAEVKALYEGDGAPVAMKCAVTFDAAGGTAEWTKGEVAKGAALGTLPTATREGYSFDGWYTAASGGTKVTSATTVVADVTYYAHWTQNVTYYTVTFNANGGSSSVSSKQYASGSTLEALPTATREGYSFDGWYSAASGGTKATSSTAVTGNATYYAHWVQNVTYYTVTFNANGGSCSTSSKQYSSGSTLGTLPTATRSGYTFNGWYTAASGGKKLSDSTPVTADMTLYAQWTQNVTYYTVTFNANGGSCSTSSKQYTSGSMLGTLPTATREGYSFDGWYSASSGGTKVTSSTAITGNATYYAHWIPVKPRLEISDDGGFFVEKGEELPSDCLCFIVYADFPAEIKVTGLPSWLDYRVSNEGPHGDYNNHYYVYLKGKVMQKGVHQITCTATDAQGKVCSDTVSLVFGIDNVFGVYFDVGDDGRCSEWLRWVEPDQALGALPIATREGYVLEGWYTAAVGGTKVTASTTVTGEMELYAHWTKIESMSCAIGGTGVSAGSAGLFSEGGCTMWVKEGDDWSADGGVLSSPLATYDWATMEQTLLAMRFGSRGILSFEYRIEDESGREMPASFSEAYAPESEYESWDGPVLWFMDEGRVGGWQTAQIEVLSTGWDYHLCVQASLEEGRRVRFRNFKWHSIPAKVTFTLDPAGGTVSPSTITLSTSGTFGNSLPRPSRKDCTFLGWRRGASPVSSTMPVFLSDSTLYADWSIPLRNALDPSGTLKSALFADDWSSWAGVDESGNPDSGLFCMHIEGSGRTALLTVTVEGVGKLKWTRLGIEDSQSVRLMVDGSEYRAFKNWSVFGGDTADVELSFDRTGAHTIKLEAEAGKIAMIKSGPMLWTGTAPAVAVFSVFFDAMGGDCVERARDVESGKSVGTLPTPVRSKHKFLGWYTQPEGGTKISASTKVTASVTYYAHWQYDGSVYVRVSVAEDCEGMGTVSGGNKSVKGGSSVTLTAKPAKGYVFSQWRPVGVTEDGWEDFWNAYEIYNPSLKIKAGSEDVAFEASFVPVDSSRLCVPGFDEWHDNVGVALREGLTVWDADRFVSIEGESASLVKFTVSGVPSGVKYKVHNQVLVFYGTPSREGIYWVTYTIKNAGGYQATSVLKWTIGNPKQTDYDNIGLDRQSDDWKRISNLYVGEALSDALCLDNWVGARYGETITKWTISGLPSGLKLQQNCRGRYVITGMPTKAGKYTLTITATYADKHTAKAAQTIVVTTDPYGSGYVLVTVDPECGHMGSASGGGVCAKAAKAKLSAKANKGYVFAGWYDGGGDRWMNTDSGDWRKASDSYVLRAGDGWPEFYARFVPQANDRAVTIRCPSEWIVECSNVGNLLYDVCSFDVESASLPTVTVSGLPSGCKFDKVNMRLVFEKQPPKPGISRVTIKAKNVSGATDEKALYVKVPNLRSDVFDGIDYDRDYKVPQYDSMVVCYKCWVSFSARSGWTVAASGLPSGLKLVKDSYGSYMVVGTATKAGAFTVTLTAKNGGVSEKATFTMIVDPLPDYAIGTFNGVLLGWDSVIGTFTMTSTSSGRVSATLVTLDGNKHTYSANAWSCISEEKCCISFTKKVRGDCWDGGSGEEHVNVAISRGRAWDDCQLTGTFDVNPCVEGGLGEIAAQHNPFGKVGKDYENWEAHSIAARLAGFGKIGVFVLDADYGEYDLECPGCVHMPDGAKPELTFTVAVDGAVKVAGMIAGKSVSGSSALRIIDGEPQADFILLSGGTPIRVCIKFHPNCNSADFAVANGTAIVGW